MGGERRENILDMRPPRLPLAPQTLRLPPPRVKPVGAGDGEQPGAGHLLPHQGERLLRLRRQRPLIGDGEFRPWRGGHGPMRSGDDMRGVERPGGLGQHEIGKTQPDRRTIRPLHIFESVAHHDSQLITIGWLEGGQLVLHDAEQRRVGGLMLAALRRQGDPRRGGDEKKTRILVAGIIKRVVPAIDERIVHRADGQQPRAVKLVRQPGGAEQKKQALLGDAQLYVLAVRMHVLTDHRGDLVLAENIRLGLAGEHAAPVDPGGEVGGGGDIRAGGDDGPRQRRGLGLGPPDLGEDLAKAGLGAHSPPGDARLRQFRRHRHGGRGEAASARGQRRGVRRLAQQPLDPVRMGEPLERIPFMARADAHLGAELVHLFGRHQPGMVVLVARQRQAVALDGVGEENRGLAGGGGRGEALQKRGEIMPGQIGHQLRQLGIAQRADERARPPAAAKVAQQRLAPGRAALKGERGIDGIRAFIQPMPQAGAARLGERLLQPLAVAQGNDPPAHIAEQPLEPAEEPVWHDGIQALAVTIHHPPDIADIVLPAFQQGFVDIALVQLRIARDGDMPRPRRAWGPKAMRLHIILNQRGEAGDGDAKPDGTGGEINLRPIGGAGGVGLGAAELAKILQLLQALPAQQIIDGVEHGSGVGFDRHAVLRPQGVKIQRRHEGGDGGAGCLMPAHLRAGGVGTDVVGVMNGPGGQPEKLALDGGQRFQTPLAGPYGPHFIHGPTLQESGAAGNGFAPPEPAG